MPCSPPKVKGKDGIGAKMDSMDLEREKGITIQSAATHVQWKDHHINIIDTPGHVDFTIEVERALRVLDGAIMVFVVAFHSEVLTCSLCSVGAVQSQSITVDRQMKRYNVPRLVFINKCDRLGADPWRGIEQLQEKLKLRAVPIQYPIGLAADHCGVVDILTRRAYIFQGDSGQSVDERDVPPEMVDVVEETRSDLLNALGELDDEIGEMIVNDVEPTIPQIKAAIRRQTIATKFVPVFMGSAIKNKGVQLLLDGVLDYLPSPGDVYVSAFFSSTHL